MSRVKKAWTNIILLVTTLAANAAGAFGLINGLSQKDISDKYQTLITPAPMTFSIWSVIYVLLITSLIVLIIKHDKEYYGKGIDRISLLFWLSCLFNILWIVSFSYLQLALSVVFIFLLLVMLTLISQKLIPIHSQKKILLPLTFGLYSGWVFIATVINIAALLVKNNWNGFSIADSTWAMLILGVSVVLTALVLLKVKNAAFPLPIAWGFWGIYQFLKDTNGFQGQYPGIEWTALVGIILLVLLSGLTFYRNRYSLLPRPENR